MDLNDRPTDFEDTEEDEEDDIEEIIESEDLIVRCEAMEKGIQCNRHGICVRYDFRHGEYDICDYVIFEDAVDSQDAPPFEGVNN